jgi:hypothetical protein
VHLKMLNLLWCIRPLSKLGEPFEVISETSLVEVRVVLLQRGRPIAFRSWKFFHVERNYTIGG